MPLNTLMQRITWLLLIASLAACTTTEQVAQATPEPQSREKFGDPTQYESTDLPVSIEDLRTLERASALLANESAWNRNDDRICTDDEAMNKRSLFCALTRASAESYGSHDSRRVADHRRVALQEVRFAVQEATRGRDLEHRLMDFNNLPETRLADVQRVLARATERVRARLAAE